MSCSFLLSSGSHNASPALAYLFPDFFCLCCFTSCCLTDVECVCFNCYSFIYNGDCTWNSVEKWLWGGGGAEGDCLFRTLRSQMQELYQGNKWKGKPGLCSLFPNGKEQISPSKFIWIGSHQQYIWASLVAQIIKPAMQETHVWSLGWEDPLEKGVATHSSILAWRIP